MIVDVKKKGRNIKTQLDNEKSKSQRKSLSITSETNKIHISNNKESSRSHSKSNSNTVNNVSLITYKKRTVKNKSMSNFDETFFEENKLENYFLKVKLYTDLIDKEYRKYKEKYFKYKSKFINLVNEIKRKDFFLHSNLSNIDPFILTLKGYCDISIEDAGTILSNFNNEEKDVIIDLFRHCESNSYSDLIRKLVEITYIVSQRKFENMSFSDYSDVNEEY